MRFIADLHIHSKYSRATSKQMVLEEIDRVADEKGILVMGTGDFLHPRWLKEIKKKLEPVEQGLFKLKQEYKKKTVKENFSETRFILSVEISSIYSRSGRTRRVHNLVFVPSIESAEKLRNELIKLGCNLNSDGRPIIGLDSEKLAEIAFKIDNDAVIIPAHAWTPWFSVFGSMSGFDSIEECFGKYAGRIFAIETGLSSDPEMNWQVSGLDNIALISNSDSHSLQKIGREANIFDADLSYNGIMQAIKNSSPIQRRSALSPISRNSAAMLATLEFFPEEGKYHYDGHVKCKIVFSPQESKKYNNICPKCGKPLTIGVLNRVGKLSDRKIKLESEGNYHGYGNFVPYYNLVGLEEIIAESFGIGPKSKKVSKEYERLVKEFGSEIKILMDIKIEDLKKSAGIKIAEGISRVRKGKLDIKPGYDGEYGVVKIF